MMVLAAIIHHCKSISCYSPKSKIADVDDDIATVTSSKYVVSRSLELLPRQELLFSIMYPIVNSVIEETLQWAGRSSTIHLAEKDGKFIPVQKGEYVIADARALHFNLQGYPDTEI